MDVEHRPIDDMPREVRRECLDVAWEVVRTILEVHGIEADAIDALEVLDTEISAIRDNPLAVH
jgi:hypothetical protein